MKNFNRYCSHGHHGSKHQKLAQHAHSRGSHAFTHTLTSTWLQPHCAKRQLSCIRIWNNIFILKVPEGGGENRSAWRKPSTACLLLHITNQGRKSTSRTGLEPSPSNVDDKLAWPRACTASDPLSDRSSIQIDRSIDRYLMFRSLPVNREGSNQGETKQIASHK